MLDRFLEPVMVAGQPLHEKTEGSRAIAGGYPYHKKSCAAGS